MNLNQLRMFEHLSYTLYYQKTADELGISQPSLSRSIRQLEIELGAELFEKEGRGVKLSRYGSVFASHIVPAMQEIETGVLRVREMADPKNMNIYVGVNYYLATTYLPKLTRKFLDERENTEYFFQFIQDNTAGLLDALRSGAIEIGFCSHMEDQPDIRFKPIARPALYAVVPEDHALAEKADTSLEEIAQYPMILSTDQTYYLENLFRAQGLVPKVAFRMSEDHAIANMVASGFGVAVLPYAKQLSACGVRLVPLRDRGAYRYFYIATSRKRDLSNPAREFYRFALEERKGDAGENWGGQPRLGRASVFGH